MKNQFLTRKQVAERMNVCPKLAMAILENEGISPIDLGRGKKAVLRWPEDVVQAVMTNMYDRSQPKQVSEAKLPKTKGIATMSVNRLHELTLKSNLQ